MRKLLVIAAVIAALAMLHACGGPRSVVPVPAADAPPTQVLEAFLAASQAGDDDAGQALSGDHWSEVSHWFTNRGDRLTSYRVDEHPIDDPGPEDRDVSIWFDFTTEDDQPQGRWKATLTRDDAASPWRVAHLEPVSG